MRRGNVNVFLLRSSRRRYAAEEKEKILAVVRIDSTQPFHQLCAQARGLIS
jgi:hypothetical protein